LSLFTFAFSPTVTKEFGPSVGLQASEIRSLFHVFVERYRHNLIRDVEVCVDFLHVVVLFEGLYEAEDRNEDDAASPWRTTYT
jgi:hypothetical protein